MYPYCTGHELPGTDRHADEYKHTRKHTTHTRLSQSLPVKLLSRCGESKLELQMPTCVETVVARLMLKDAKEDSVPSCGRPVCIVEDELKQKKNRRRQSKKKRSTADRRDWGGGNYQHWGKTYLAHPETHI